MMEKIGIDVGGTNTDAVWLSGDQVVASYKSPTTSNITSGIQDALKNVLMQVSKDAKPHAVMIGTTHFVNAVIQRKFLNQIAILRIGLPASASLPPLSDWPQELAQKVLGQIYIIEGGHEYDGKPLVKLDEHSIAQAAKDMKQKGMTSVAVSAIFSPLNRSCEERASEILSQEYPDLRITTSATLGRIGLLERENIAALNASLLDLANHTIQAFIDSMQYMGIQAPLFLTQNDGTIIPAHLAKNLPVYSFSSGPTNSMRGAAFLSGFHDAMVCDVGGTTSDIGALNHGFPREANSVVEVGGVRTLFRMPDILSIGIGGGTKVWKEPLKIGPESVGFRLPQKALIFGGDTLTCSDLCVASGLLKLGDASKVQGLDTNLIQTAFQQIEDKISLAIDSMKTSATELPLLAVGGGAMLVPNQIEGISEVIHVKYKEVANAVGAAIAQVSGEVDQIYIQTSRQEALDDALQKAQETAKQAGASEESLRTIESESIPLSYITDALRIRVRVIGDLQNISHTNER